MNLDSILINADWVKKTPDTYDALMGVEDALVVEEPSMKKYVIPGFGYVRDGDGDGYIFDGTPNEQPAPSAIKDGGIWGDWKNPDELAKIEWKQGEFYSMNGMLMTEFKAAGQNYHAALFPDNVSGDTLLNHRVAGGDGSKGYDFSFYDEELESGTTGKAKGKARQVMKKATQRFASVLQQKNPSYVRFKASTEGDGRRSLYRFMTSRASELFPNHTGVAYQDRNDAYYAVVRNDKLDAFVSAVNEIKPGRVKILDRNQKKSWEMDDEFWDSVQDALIDPQAKHYGPHNHKSGSPQSVHGSVTGITEKYTKQRLSDELDEWMVLNGVETTPWKRPAGYLPLPSDAKVRSIADEQVASTGLPDASTLESYEDFKSHLLSQYEAIKRSGLKVYAWEGEGEPYKSSPDKLWSPSSNVMRQRVEETGEFHFFMTNNGFGDEGAGESSSHPLLEMSPVTTSDGKPMLYNDVFRVVHDAVAHLNGGYSFSTRGEMNAMVAHATTLPRSAWPALWAETFAQNAVYETTGKFADQNVFTSSHISMLDGMVGASQKKSLVLVTESDPDHPLAGTRIMRRPEIYWMHIDPPPSIAKSFRHLRKRKS